MRNRDCVKKCLALMLSVSMAVQPGCIALAEETEQEAVQSTGDGNRSAAGRDIRDGSTGDGGSADGSAGN